MVIEGGREDREAIGRDGGVVFASNGRWEGACWWFMHSVSKQRIKTSAGVLKHGLNLVSRRLGKQDKCILRNC